MCDIPRRKSRNKNEGKRVMTTIPITNVPESTTIVIFVLLALFLLSFRKTQHVDLFPITLTQELKGLGILTVIFAHISYMLVSDYHFLYPLSIASGVGVDLFLFMSGYGLSIGMLKKPLPALEFYKRRMIKIFIPFWLVLFLLFVADALFLDVHYSLSYMAQSFFGWFPYARGEIDVNSPLWYITWILMFYILFPLLFSAKRLWLSAILLSVIAHVVVIFNPFDLQSNWLHSTHTISFSLGMLLAWFLYNKPEVVAKLQFFRNESTGAGRYIVIGSMLFLGAYMVLHATSDAWVTLSSLLKSLDISSRIFIDQMSSLVAMLAVLIVFSLKRVDNKFLYFIGVYSYEIYLVHWPLMARYDIVFHTLPAWLAVFVWLVIFVALGWLLQKITTPLGMWMDKKW